MHNGGPTKTRKPLIRVRFINNTLVIKARLNVKGHDISIDVDLPVGN